MLSRGPEQTRLVLEGIELAKEFQKNLMQEAQYLIEKKAVIPCQEFRYALIKSDTQIVI
jgi:hypothetical protein